MSNHYLAWFDGACEPVNPGGTATFGVVVRDGNGTILLMEHGLVGEGSAMSNNVAEYAGVLQVLKYFAHCPPGRVTIHGDSNMVINQLNGKWRVRKGLYVSTAIEAKALLAHLHGLGWEINFCWSPRAQNEECDALSKMERPQRGMEHPRRGKGCPTEERPHSTHRKVHKPQDPRDKSMVGRTVKTTGITVLKAAPKGSDGTSPKGDWWVCKCPCGREFIAHGWNVRHGRTRNCGGDEHKVQPSGHQVLVVAL